MTKGELIEKLSDYDDDVVVAVVVSAENLVEDGDVLSLDGSIRMSIVGHSVLLEAELPISD
jgi:hypothetical protein